MSPWNISNKQNEDIYIYIYIIGSSTFAIRIQMDVHVKSGRIDSPIICNAVSIFLVNLVCSKSPFRHARPKQNASAVAAEREARRDGRRNRWAIEEATPPRPRRDLSSVALRSALVLDLRSKVGSWDPLILRSHGKHTQLDLRPSCGSDQLLDLRLPIR